MSIKSHIFTAASCLVAGASAGLYFAKAPQEGTPAPAAVATTASSLDATVTAAPRKNVLHVRVHTWVAEFKMASVCARGQVAEPKPCDYEAVFDEARPGSPVTLRDFSSASGQVAAHKIEADLPAIRPRQDVVAGPIAAKVVKLVDGDTVQVLAETFPGAYVLTDVRIGEIDTPEKKGRAKCAREAELAEQASDATQSLIAGKDVLLYNIKFEKYGGRVLGDIRTQDGVSAAQSLIDQNLALPYDGGKKRSWCGMQK